LFIAARSGLPSRSTQFWIPDQPFQMDCEGKRIRYRYPTADGGRTLAFVGFQEPVEVIPPGTLVRVSLAHWWRPKDKPEEELRCYVQLSGWHGEAGRTARGTALHLPRIEAGQREGALIQPGAAAAGEPIESPGAFDQARQLLKQCFGFTQFLPTQEAVIRRILEGKDTLAVMPTGGGKSLCYQLPALVFDRLTLVVSPLIALMQDQVHQLRALNIPAAFLNSTLAYRDYLAVANCARAGGLKVLFTAPETLLRPETLVLLDQCRVACIAVDEAHCISEWGHDFRPEYRQLHEIRRRFPAAVCIALTATATPRVRSDIRSRLGIQCEGEFVASFNRPNLFLAAQPRHDGLAQTLGFLKGQRNQAGIIYCTSRKQVDQLAAELAGRGWPALPYHAGLDDVVRCENQDRFVREDGLVMVATIAFGMGINKSNVRFVLHYNLPKDLESYYQEIGRAGRDGLPAQCLLLHSRADAVVARQFIERGAASERPGRQARLEAMLRYAQTLSCRRQPLLGYFGEAPQGNCGQCDRCICPAAATPAVDITEPAQKFLSCVKRTGETFGAGHIIDVLRGSHSEKVIARQHDQLSTYGIGRDLSGEAWRALAGQFIDQGLLEQDFRYGSLRITAKGWRVLKGEKAFGTLDAAPVKASESQLSAADFDPGLFEELRVLRRRIALEAGVPSYVVFSDRALIEMARFRPRNDQEFLAINGVGEVKLQKYGAPFLERIRKFGNP
jgi:ATP-dependent DNA helicase RecQ